MATQTIITGDTSFDSPNAGDSFYITSGGQALVGNSDASGVNTMVLAEIQPGFSGTIGTATDPWKAAFSSYLLYNAQAGMLHYESNSLDTETTALVAVTGGGNLFVYGAGILTRFEVSSGRATVANASTVTTGRVNGGMVKLLDTGSAPTVVLLQVGGGETTSQRAHTTIDGFGGDLTLAADSAGAVNAQGTINWYAGTLRLQDTGTITKLNWYGGTIDASQLSRPTTVTAIDINMRAPGAQAFLDNSLFTFSTAPTFTGTTSKRLMSDGRPL